MRRGQWGMRGGETSRCATARDRVRYGPRARSPRRWIVCDGASATHASVSDETPGAPQPYSSTKRQSQVAVTRSTNARTFADKSRVLGYTH